MRARSSSDSWSGREKAFDTVIRLTPSRSAIDCSVTFVIGTPVELRPRPEATNFTGTASLYR